MTDRLPFSITYPKDRLSPDGPYVEIGQCASPDLNPKRFLRYGCDVVETVEVRGRKVRKTAKV